LRSLTGRKGEQRNDVSLYLFRQLVKLRFNQFVSLLARQSSKSAIDHANPNRGRVIAVRIDLVETSSG
jgi:hypothetical protein